MATLIAGLGGLSGFGENVVPAGDFQSAPVDLRPVFGRGLTLLGVTYAQLYVNSTGSVSFGGPLSTVNLGALSGATGIPVFAPFIADIVTTAPQATSPGGTSTGAGRVWYDLDPDSHSITVTWDDVRGYFTQDPLTRVNAFQLRITGVPDASGAYDGNFDVEYRYETISWTTGNEQGGTAGLGGSPARAGYGAGNGRDYLELPASGDQAALLALDTASNAGDPGLFQFQSRGGRIAPVFSAESVRVAEGSAGAPGQAFVTVTLSTPLAVAATVRYDLAPGLESAFLSAFPFSDYVPRSGILTFAPGLTSQTVLIDLVGDDLPEGEEHFTLLLSQPSAGATAISGTIAIPANDGAPELPIVLVGDAQAGESAGTIDFVLRLSAPQAEAVSGFYAFAFREDTTASQDDVTVPEFGSVSFAPGQTEVTVSFAVAPDSLVEGTEQFFVNFNVGSGGTTTARGTIRDDDGFSVGDVAVTEADTTFATFTVTLPAPLAEKATVFYGTSSGSAVAGQDYAATSGELTFAPGVTSQTVQVLIFDDGTAEVDEQFSLVLSSPSANASIADGKGIATVTDTDGISIADFSVAEGTNNKFNPVFMSVTLAQPSAGTVTVDYQVEAGTAAPGGDDFSLNGRSGTVTFAPGQTKASVIVGVAGDSTPEPDETIRVVLSNAVGSTISDGSATLTIQNDDGALPLVAAIASQTVSEGSDTGIQHVPVTVFLNRLSTLPVTVSWLLVGDDAGGGTASPGPDFVQSAGTTTIPAGKLSATFDVMVMRNATVEPDETLTLRVLKAQEGVAPAIAGPDGILTIANDDTTFSLSYSSVFRSEGVWAAAPLTVTVTRAGDLSQEQFVGWEIPLDSDVTAADFAATSGMVGFAPGQETATFTVTVIDDAAVEGTENFSIALPLLPAGGLAGPGVGSAIAIRNDDTRIRLLAPESFLQFEHGQGHSEPRLRVVVEGNLTVARNVTWTITGNGDTPATAADFTAMTGTLFIPGQGGLFNSEASYDLLIPILNDNLVEPAEGYTVTLSDAGPGATIETPGVSAVIRNDDVKATLAAAKASQAEGSSGGTTAFAFTVTLDPPAPRPLLFKTFSWSVGAGTTPGTVSAGAADFAGGVLPSGKLTIGPDDTSATIIVPVAADTAAELNESFTLTLFDGATVVGKASATILNDDTNLSIAATSATKPEGSGASPTPYTFTVTRTGDLSKATTAKWAAAGTTGTGTLPANAADFAGGELPGGTVSFAAGQKTQLITVNVAADRTVETNERFAVTLSAPSSGASIATASAGAIIQNDDTAGTGTLAIARLRAARAEGQSGSTDFTFQVTRSGTTTGAAAVDWSVAGGGVSGTGGVTASDLAAGMLPSGSISFAAGETARTITIPVKGDTGNELNESFTVTLGNASQGVAIGTASATGLVWNDDAPGTGTLSIARLSAQKAEGASGTAAFTFTVARTGTLTGTASADWAVTGGGVAGTGAAGAADFAGGILPSGRVSFTVGQGSTVVTVTVAGDIAAELNESFTITLSGTQAGVALGTATATGAILNDDFASTGGNETLNGTTGPDVFQLGGGVDTIYGKGGTDLFLFGPAALGDGLTNGSLLGDFSGSTGERLDLSAIDAIAGGGTANDAFSFIGTAAFTAPGQLRWEDQGTARGVFGNVDADPSPELVIYLATPGPVQQGWIVL